MSQPDLTVTFKGMEEAKPGQACYDPAQPWFAYVLINNCKFIDKEKGIADAKNPTGPSAPCKVRLDIMKGDKLSSGTAYSVAVDVDALSGYSDSPDTNPYIIGLSIKLPVQVKKADFGSKYAFRITVDSGSEVTESEENNNIFTWEKGTVPQAAIFSSGEIYNPAPPADQNWKIIDTAAKPDSLRDVQVRIKNMGDAPSMEELVTLTVYEDPVAGQPTAVGSIQALGKVPSLAPGNSTWLTLTAEQDFIRPLPAATAQPASEPQAYIQRSRGAQQFQIRRRFDQVARIDQSQLQVHHFTQVEHCEFKVLRPFSIRIGHDRESVGFGRAPIETGKRIRIPGKR